MQFALLKYAYSQLIHKSIAKLTSLTASIFGTLYGIIIAFVVFEVWVQFNRLALYFKNRKFSGSIKKSIENYANMVVKGNFQKLAVGERNKQTSKALREIHAGIADIKISSPKEQIVFRYLIELYDNLSETRTERISQGLIRLPIMLKTFLYAASLFTLAIFIVMPFSNPFYGFLTTGTFGFVIVMVFQIIEDLDNPFVGFWKVTTEPFTRVLKHIEEDY